MNVKLAVLAVAATVLLGRASTADAEEPLVRSASSQVEPEGTTQPARPKRPPPLEPLELRSLPKAPRVELGVGPLARAAHVEHAFGDVPVGANVSPGVAILARVPIADVFSMEALAGWSRMSLDLAVGDFVRGGAIDSMDQDTFSFELTMAPAIFLGDRVKLFGLLGIGFLTSSVGLTEVEVDARRAVIPDRERWHFSVPVGVGVAFHLIPDWLDLGVRSWMSPTFAEGGDGTDRGTIYDGSGAVRALAPMPSFPFWLTQTVTLGIVL